MTENNFKVGDKVEFLNSIFNYPTGIVTKTDGDDVYMNFDEPRKLEKFKCLRSETYCNPTEFHSCKGKYTEFKLVEK